MRNGLLRKDSQKRLRRRWIFCWAERRLSNHGFGELQGSTVFGPALHGYIKQEGTPRAP